MKVLKSRNLSKGTTFFLTRWICIQTVIHSFLGRICKSRILFSSGSLYACDWELQNCAALYTFLCILLFNYYIYTKIRKFDLKTCRLCRHFGKKIVGSFHNIFITIFRVKFNLHNDNEIVLCQKRWPGQNLYVCFYVNMFIQIITQPPHSWNPTMRTLLWKVAD